MSWVQIDLKRDQDPHDHPFYWHNAIMDHTLLLHNPLEIHSYLLMKNFHEFVSAWNNCLLYFYWSKYPINHDFIILITTVFCFIWYHLSTERNRYVSPFVVSHDWFVLYEHLSGTTNNWIHVLTVKTYNAFTHKDFCSMLVMEHNDCVWNIMGRTIIFRVTTGTKVDAVPWQTSIQERCVWDLERPTK